MIEQEALKHVFVVAILIAGLLYASFTGGIDDDDFPKN